MGVYVSLDEAKTEVRLHPSITTFDTLLNTLITRAEARVHNLVEGSIEDYKDIDTDEIPEDLKGAILMLVGHWFQNPTGVAPTQLHQIPEGIYDLVSAYQGPIFKVFNKTKYNES